MSTSTAPTSTPVQPADPIAGASLLLGGVTFFAGGALHPSDSGAGSKVAQLHEMLGDTMWYPSHALLLVAMAAFAVAIVRIRRRAALDGAMATVTGVVAVVAVVAVMGMTLHLVSALGADAIADGQPSLAYRLQALNETLIDASWGLAIAALAVAGGLSRRLGNPITLPLGLVGGLAFALASGTIAYTDRFDGLFPVGSLIGVWGLVVGLMVLLRRNAEPTSGPAAGRMATHPGNVAADRPARTTRTRP